MSLSDDVAEIQQVLVRYSIALDARAAQGVG